MKYLQVNLGLPNGQAVASSVHEACQQLGIETEGGNLTDLADKCIIILRGDTQSKQSVEPVEAPKSTPPIREERGRQRQRQRVSSDPMISVPRASSDPMIAVTATNNVEQPKHSPATVHPVKSEPPEQVVSAPAVPATYSDDFPPPPEPKFTDTDTDTVQEVTPEEPTSNVGWIDRGWSSFDNYGLWVSCCCVGVIQCHCKEPLVVDGKKDPRKMKKAGVNIFMFIPSVMKEETWTKQGDTCFWQPEGAPLKVWMPIPCCEMSGPCYCGVKLCPDCKNLE